MAHDYGCKIYSRVWRIDQLSHRICKAKNRSEALTWRRDLRKAMAQLTALVDARCDAIEADALAAVAASSEREGG